MTALVHATRFPAMRATQPARQIAHTVHGWQRAWNAWSQARRQASADREMWNAAKADARVMSDLTCAISRHGN